ncbi:MAG: hypothetical protein ACLPY1_17980 [Terracidiphilus sp.]
MADLPENPGSQGSPAPPPFQPVASQYQPAATPAPVYGAPAPAPIPAKSGGSSAVKIILIVVAIFVFLGVLAVGVIGYIGWRVTRAVHVNNSTGAVTMSTPGGTFSANSAEKFTPEELGTDIYPGAEQSKAGGNMRMSMPSGSVISASFLSSDAKEKVVDFYKSKLGSDATTMDFGNSAIVSLKKGNKEQLTITIAQQANQFDGKTQIHIMHTTDNGSK